MPAAENREWPLVLSDALYRRLLVLYPKGFRSTYGAAMAQVFRDQVRDRYRTRGTVGMLALWPTALGDLMCAAAGEHLVQERHMGHIEHLSGKIVAVLGSLVVLTNVFLALALPRVFAGLVAVVGAVLRAIAFRPVLNLLLVVYGTVQSLPLALVLVTVVFQLCLLLLWRRQFRPAPVLVALRVRAQQLHEQQDLTRRDRVHPLAISVWVLLQVLFLYALYGCLNVLFVPFNAYSVAALLRINSEIYPFLPKLTVLPDTHFLWLQGASSLLTPDPWHILPVVAVLLTVLVVHVLLRRATRRGGTAPRRLRTGLANGLGQSGVALLTLGIGLLFPAGLALSWGVSMLIAMARHSVLLGRSPWS